MSNRITLSGAVAQYKLGVLERAWDQERTSHANCGTTGTASCPLDKVRNDFDHAGELVRIHSDNLLLLLQAKPFLLSPRPR